MFVQYNLQSLWTVPAKQYQDDTFITSIHFFSIKYLFKFKMENTLNL